jgi:uncharacterized Zn finger protein (UPF0148 family)
MNEDYCAECGIVLWPAPRGGMVHCNPCGQNVCDRLCLAEHKRHCDPSLEAKARREAKALMEAALK